MRKLTLDGTSAGLPSEDDQAEAENQMRQALGLPSNSTRRDNREVKERSGPGVTVEHRVNRHGLHQNVNRLQQAEEALAAEQAAHQLTSRTLRTVQEQLLEANTKLGHSELARQEAVEARTRAINALTAERETREALERELEELRSRPPAPKPAEEVAEPAKRRRVGRPPAAAEPVEEDAEPVQWWVPGWRRQAG